MPFGARIQKLPAVRAAAATSALTPAKMQLRYVTVLMSPRLPLNSRRSSKGRALDDHFTIYCKLRRVARRWARATQTAIGPNHLGLKSTAPGKTPVWRQEDPECSTIHLSNQPDRVYWRGGDSRPTVPAQDVPADLDGERTVPPGHPEAFHDAFYGCIGASKPTSGNGKWGRPFAVTVEGRECGGRLDGHCVHRDLPQEWRQEGTWTAMPKSGSPFHPFARRQNGYQRFLPLLT